jgi:deoxyribonuclease V
MRFWLVSPEQASHLQEDLRQYLILTPLGEENIITVGGVDASYTDVNIYAAAVVVDYASQSLQEWASATLPISYPYIPGLLAFRESPAILEALAKLKTLPDVLIVDGHGIAHPRRFGIACHLGLILDLPTIGCAKSILIGNLKDLPKEDKSQIGLFDNQQDLLGMAVCTIPGVKPVYISAGHRIDLESAVRVIQRCCRGYRLPEPVRLAHKLAKSLARPGGGMLEKIIIGLD